MIFTHGQLCTPDGHSLLTIRTKYCNIYKCIESLISGTLVKDDCFICKAEEGSDAVASLADGNAADEQSGKSMSR